MNINSNDISVMILDNESPDLTALILRGQLDYKVDFAEIPSLAGDIFSPGKYKALIVEPFRAGDVQPGVANEIPDFMRYVRANDPNIKIIVTSIMAIPYLEQKYGIKLGKDYNQYFGKPISVEDELVPFLRETLEQK